MYMTIKEVCEALGCSESSVRRRIESGELPAVHPPDGGPMQIDAAYLDGLQVRSYKRKENS